MSSPLIPPVGVVVLAQLIHQWQLGIEAACIEYW